MISVTASPTDHSCWRNFERYAEKNVNGNCIKTPKQCLKAVFEEKMWLINWAGKDVI